MVDWIVKTSIRPNRMMALGTSLGVAGTLMGRHIEGPSYSASLSFPSRTYRLGQRRPAPSGRHHNVCGRPTPDRDSEFASSPGSMKRLAQNPLFICFVDEFGDELDKIKCQGNNAFVRNMIGTLKKCWNGFNSFNTPTKASEAGTRIEWAAPSIIAAATPERFFGALTTSDFESGFINRFLILPFEQTPTGADKGG